MKYLILSYTILLIAVVLGSTQFRRLAPSLRLVDIPNARSSHHRITPRAGGLVFVSAWVIWMIFALLTNLVTMTSFLPLIPSVLLISTVGLLDDRYQLSAKWRFSVQLIAALLFLIQLGAITDFQFGLSHFSLGILGYFFAAILLLWSINLFNFMDGTDGIACVEAITVLTFGGILLLSHNGLELSIICWSVCTALIGFLVWNWPPAKIFMGDVGSTTLGFLIIAIALMAQKYHNMSLVPWIILYAAFLFDATATLLRRIFRGEQWYSAHKSHAYQRLYQAGCSHAQILYYLLILNSGFVFLALLSDRSPQYAWLTLLAASALAALSYSGIQLYTQKKPKI